MALTAVFDTNILFSATAWRGNPFQCVERARVGEIQAVTCLDLSLDGISFFTEREPDFKHFLITLGTDAGLILLKAQVRVQRRVVLVAFG